MSAFRESSHLGATSPVRQFSFPTQNTYLNQGNRQVYASNVAPYNHGLNTINPPTATYSSIQRPPMTTTSYVANPVNQIQTYPIQQQQQVTYSNTPSQPTVVYHQGSVEPKRDTIVRDPIVQKRVIHVEDQPVGQYQSQYIAADPRESRRYYQRHEEGYKPKPTSSICNPCCLSILGLLLLAGLLVGGYFIVQAIQNGAGEPQQVKRDDIKYEGTYRQVDIEEGDDGQAIIDSGEEETPLSPAVVDIDQNPEPANHTVKRNETSPAVIQSDSNPAPSQNTTSNTISENTTSSNITVKNQAPVHNLKVTKTEPIAVKQGSQKEQEQKKEKDPLVIRVKPNIVRQQQEQKPTETKPEEQKKEEEDRQQKQSQETAFQEQNQNQQRQKESQAMANTQQEKNDDEQQQKVAVFVEPEPEQATQVEAQTGTQEEEEEKKPEKKGLPEIMFQRRPEKKGSMA